MVRDWSMDSTPVAIEQLAFRHYVKVERDLSAVGQIAT